MSSRNILVMEVVAAAAGAGAVNGAPTSRTSCSTFSSHVSYVEQQNVGSSSCAGGRSNSLKRVCVFCGAYRGSRHVYQDATIELGKELVKRKLSLVYGGANVGLMGMISEVVHGGGQRVIGIIPKALVSIVKMEGGIEPVGEVVEVDDMHQRKAEMERLADAFVALPGGFGTLEELLEQITWLQLGIHNKPVGLLNVDGYYDSLLAFLDGAVQEGFIAPACRDLVVVASNPHDLMNQLESRVAARSIMTSKCTHLMQHPPHHESMMHSSSGRMVELH